MITQIVNGYNVTGNYAKTGREYRVSRADGKVVATKPGKPAAVVAATAMPPGDVPEPQPEPPKATARPAAKKTAKAKPVIRKGVD